VDAQETNFETTMSQSYLLACECGGEIAVRTQQAGGRTICECGREVDVPKLGELRKLPAAPLPPISAPNRWTVSVGLFFSCSALISLISLAVLLYLWNERRQLDVEQPAVADLMILEDVDTWSLEESYDRWAKNWRDAPLVRIIRPRFLEDRQRMAILNRRLILAGVCLAVGVTCVGLAAVWGGSPSGTR
jgi:hypothetical protein